MKNKKTIFRIQDYVGETEFNYQYINPCAFNVYIINFIRHDGPVVLPYKPSTEMQHSSYFDTLWDQLQADSLKLKLIAWHWHFLDGRDKEVVCTDKTVSLSLQPNHKTQIIAINKYFYERILYTFLKSSTSPCYGKHYAQRFEKVYYDVRKNDDKIHEVFLSTAMELMSERNLGPFFEKAFDVFSELYHAPTIDWGSQIWSYSQLIVMAYAREALRFYQYLTDSLTGKQDKALIRQLITEPSKFWNN